MIRSLGARAAAVIFKPLFGQSRCLCTAFGSQASSLLVCALVWAAINIYMQFYKFKKLLSFFVVFLICIYPAASRAADKWVISNAAWDSYYPRTIFGNPAECLETAIAAWHKRWVGYDDAIFTLIEATDDVRTLEISNRASGWIKCTREKSIVISIEGPSFTQALPSKSGPVTQVILVEANNRPQSNASVSVEIKDDFGNTAQTIGGVTDLNGVFKFTYVPPYAISVNVELIATCSGCENTAFKSIFIDSSDAERLGGMQICRHH